MMEVTEMRKAGADALKEELTKLRKEAFNLRFQAATGELQNAARVRQVRRQIARVMTILREKQNAPQTKPAATKKTKKAS